MLRSQKQSQQFDEEADDEDDERHSSIELKDILKRKLPTSPGDDAAFSDEDDADTDTNGTEGSTTTAADGDTADDNHIGRLTPQYKRTHRHRTSIPLKTAALAVFLTAVGLGFLCTGVSLWWTTGGSVSDSVPFLVLGGLAFIPGSFHVVILYLAYTGQHGWTYDHIPTYERQ